MADFCIIITIVICDFWGLIIFLQFKKFFLSTEYIQVIMSMEESVQHVVMMAIQEVGVNLIYERQSTVGFHLQFTMFFFSQLMTGKESGLPGTDSEMFKELEIQVRYIHIMLGVVIFRTY